MRAKTERGKPRSIAPFVQVYGMYAGIVKSTGNKHQHRRSRLDKEFEGCACGCCLGSCGSFRVPAPTRKDPIFGEGSLLLA